MKRVSWKFLLVAVCLPACVVFNAGCPSGIVAFTGVVPQAAIDLNGTYRITITNGDATQLGENPTLVISGGLLTQLGVTAVTPTNLAVNGTNFVWTSAASITRSGSPFPVTVTVTLNQNVQGNNTMTGTIVIASGGQSNSNNPFNVTLTKQ